ncbi:hypothetical protein MBLNU457_4133t3 [Dothideomycetes sp. NU457]
MTSPSPLWRAKDRTFSGDDAAQHRRRLLDGPIDEEKISESASDDYRSFSLSQNLLALFRRRIQGWSPVHSLRHRKRSPTRRYARNLWLHRFLTFLVLVPVLVASLVILVGLFFPSYTHEPAQYRALRERIGSSHTPGRANVNNEKVFIVSSIYDEEGGLVSGAWGNAILSLVDLLGPDNVFLSIYENDADDKARKALDEYRSRVPCNSSLLSEHLPTHNLPHVTLPNGEQYVKRIAFLAEVRNRAMKPLEDPQSPASRVRFDKVLYINDVIFKPADAANLLFSTNVDDTGNTQYRAACAVDFINPFKFYDTFATKDLEGHVIGLPFFPWFSQAGNEYSRKDVLLQKDAVRVRSCWGGMVAFDARYLQADPSKTSKGVIQHSIDSALPTSTNLSASGTTVVDENLNWHWTASANDQRVTPVPTPKTAQDENLNWHWTATNIETETVPTPTSSDDHRDGNLNWNLATAYPGTSGEDFTRDVDQFHTPRRFRSDLDPFWESSECCLIHADIQEPRGEDLSAPTGIYMNPYVRVAYDTKTLSWLAFTRRFELLYPIVHRILNSWSGLLVRSYNPRRTEEAGQLVTDRVFVYDMEQWNKTGNVSGGFQDVERVALAGGFCGRRMLLALPDDSSGGSWFYYGAPFDEGDPEQLGIPPSVGRLDS